MARMSLGVSFAWMRAAMPGRGGRGCDAASRRVCCGLRFEAGAQFGERCGPAKRPSSQGAQVEAGASGDDGQVIAGGDLGKAARARRV